MHHDGAVQSNAVERYFLGTLSEAERDDFEEHYFSCPECAEDVRVAARFRANAREALREVAPAKPRPSWFRFPILVPITVGCALLLAYQNAVQIPGLKHQLRARSFSSFALRTVRGAEEPAGIRIPKDVSEFALYLDVPSGEGGPLSYQCTVENEEGKTMDSFAAPAPRGRESLNLLFHRSRLAPGRYTLTVAPAGRAPDAGGPGIDQARFAFTLE